MDIIARGRYQQGRIDLSVRPRGTISIFLSSRWSKAEPAALVQIKEKNYQQKYMGKGCDIYLIGIDFDADEKNIENFAWEKVQA